MSKFQVGNPGGPGRTSIYTQELAEEICRRIALGESLRAICRDEHMPDERTVRLWALSKEHAFFPQYARAREIAYHSMADEVLDIADDGSNDWIERHGDDDAKEKYEVNGEALQRSKLRVDTRKWMLSKVLPKIYGDKVVHQGDEDNPITHKVEKIEVVVVAPQKMIPQSIADRRAETRQ